MHEVTDHLDAARADILAFTQFPNEVLQQIWSNNPTSATPMDRLLGLGELAAVRVDCFLGLTRWATGDEAQKLSDELRTEFQGSHLGGPGYTGPVTGGT